MEKIGNGTGKPKNNKLEPLSEEKKKAIQSYMDWIQTTPEFKLELDNQIKKAFEDGRL